MPIEKKYLLVSSVFNEEQFIENTIKSVAAQTIKPIEWIIVSDASTDKTDEIIQKYAGIYPFITYLRFNNKEEFKSKLGRVAKRKTAAINAGLSIKKRNDYSFIGNLDGDMTFDEKYYENLMRKFFENEKLGLAAGYIYNVLNGHQWAYFVGPDKVGGPMQFFRRKCWEDIGGYYPGAHEDLFAGISSLMHGWEGMAFADLKAYHHKNAHLPGRNGIKVKFYLGQMDYICGEFFPYSAARAFISMKSRPYIIGGLLRLLGYLYAKITNEKQQVPPDCKEYLHKKQKIKLFHGIPFNQQDFNKLKRNIS